MAREIINGRLLTTVNSDVEAVLTDVNNNLKIVQVVSVTDTAFRSTGSIIAANDTIPTSSDGDAVGALDLTFTPKSASNSLIFIGSFMTFTGGNVFATLAFFKDSETNARAVVTSNTGASSVQQQSLFYVDPSPTETSQTWKVRLGTSSGSSGMNGGAGGSLFSTVVKSGWAVWEVEP